MAVGLSAPDCPAIISSAKAYLRIHPIAELTFTLNVQGPRGFPFIFSHFLAPERRTVLTSTDQLTANLAVFPPPLPQSNPLPMPSLHSPSTVAEQPVPLHRNPPRRPSGQPSSATRSMPTIPGQPVLRGQATARGSAQRPTGRAYHPGRSTAAVHTEKQRKASESDFRYTPCTPTVFPPATSQAKCVRNPQSRLPPPASARLTSFSEPLYRRRRRDPNKQETIQPTRFHYPSIPFRLTSQPAW